MNRLIIIGNGFDLAHGLKTRYEDFLKQYIKDQLRAYLLSDRRNEHSTKLLSIKPNNPSDDPYSDDLAAFLGSIDEHFKEIKDIRKYIFEKIIQSYGLTITINRLLGKVVSDYPNTWADIEYTYYQILLRIHKHGQIKNFTPINDELNEFQDELIKYLQNQQPEKTYDPDGYFNLFTRKSEPGLYKNQSGLANFTTSIGKTLMVSFNYTNLIDSYLSRFKQHPKYNRIDLIKIHGDMNDPVNNPIIFGYGDEKDDDYNSLEKLNDPHALEYIKSMKYFLSDNYRRTIEFVESDYFETYIIGHSCGLSDKTLLSYIFQHENCLAIHPFYHGETVNYFEKVKAISRHFDDKVMLRRKVVNLNQENKDKLKLPEILVD